MRTGTITALLMAVFVPAAWAADPPPALTAQSLAAARDAGWHEAVVSTRWGAALEQFFVEVAGYRVLWRGRADRSVSAFYGLPAADYPEVLIGDADGRPGLIRLIDFAAADADAVAIRASAQAWDTGGFFSLMTRSNDTPAVWRAAQALGWTGYNEPVAFTFGTIELRNVILRGPDGVNVSVYERLSPRLPDELDLRRLRRPFNAMQTVRDIDRTRAFYVEVLGFEIVNAGEYFNPVPGPNNFGMPANIVAEYPLRYGIFAPRKDTPTAVETVELVGAEGRRLDAIATPPNRGIVSLRYPVGDLQGLIDRLRAQQ
ncbi:MAG TPA: hypothetical protein P5528_06135, partial [Steroidobacteraceae bacterium]|nr:hypothetical protein [Steroidobacteraceae bacterium]